MRSASIGSSLRLRNALGPGDAIPTTGQIIEGSLPTRRVIEQLRDMPLPPDIAAEPSRCTSPAAPGLTTEPRHVGDRRRLCGQHQEPHVLRGFRRLHRGQGDDHPGRGRGRDGRCRGGPGSRSPSASRSSGRCSHMEHVAVTFVDTSQIGSAGSTSASRQTQMTGGAVHAAASELRDQILDRVRRRRPRRARRLARGRADRQPR